MLWRSSGQLEMNGNSRRFILDTNAIVSLLRGNKSLVDCVEQADWVGISIISKIEFLAFPDLSESDVNLFEEFQDRIDIIDLAHVNEHLISNIINLRKLYKKIKVPDAIIISTAIVNNCTLITADKKLHKVDEVEILSIEDEIEEEIEIETDDQ
jgi:tRNA(fMet)-specific endonuclease VapC